MIRYLIPITGRPNAGKTSLLNFLGRMSRPVGKHAGTTLQIETIPIYRNLSFVDFPGFGRAAKKSKRIEEKIKNNIIQFIDNPENNFLFGLHIIDASTFPIVVHSLEKKGIIPIDIEMISFVSENTKHPIFIIFNKIDKVKISFMKQNLVILKSYELPEYELFQVSLKSKEGCNNLRNRVKNQIIKELGVSYQHW
ncbi:MAG: hypothetical protein EAX86_11470 [Candidatus Heimdallarchaeota archaeon]|nr:hypothetical protein [Candidatus Heimdallarchaeota archaeon]